ncbi:hypothetical protein [Jiella pacifica]|uniref:hypothetical protein n=1 Tax=Jiella pacifica TaxID=2696469 RepID=UPI00194034FA|nr:hypothetical protein [Jiella pacifica]
MANFVLAETYRYWWPVTVHIPDPKAAGKTIAQAFEMEFEAIPQDEAEALQAAYLALETAEERAAHQHDLLKRVSKGWRNVEAPGGGEQPFSEHAFDKALQFPWFRAGVYRAMSQSMSGEARSGN